MARSKIKGITIEIGGNTTKLGQALSDVESKTKDLQKELKNVNSLLKIDPSNVELLKQKQELLTRSIEETEKKQKVLTDTMKKIDSGEIEVTEDQYRELQREIVSTGQKLKELTDKQKEFGSIAEQKLKIASKSIEEFGNKAQKTGKKVSDVGKGMLGITAGVGAITMAGISYNIEMETLESNLKVLLGSTEKANAKLKELREMGAKTPFETTDLVKATQTMLAFSLDADKTNGYLKMLGDISMGDANKLDSLTLAFSQIGASGKATMQDINQMINQGFNPLTFIAQKTGETMAELRDRVGDGEVSFQEIVDAMKTATSEGGIFYGSMDKASETTKGKLSTLKDTISELVGKLTEKLLPIFQKIVNKILEFAKWLSGLNQKTKDMIVKISLLVAAIGPLLIVVGKIISSVGSVISVLGKIVPIISSIKKGISVLFKLIATNPVIAIVTSIIAVIVLLYNKCESFRNVVNNIISFIVNLLKNTATFLSGIANWINDNVIGPVTNFIQTFIGWFVTIFQNIHNFVVNIFNSIVQIVQGCWNSVVLILSVVQEWFMNNIITPLTNFFEGLWTTISTSAQTAWDFIVDIWQAVSSWFNNNIIKPLENIFTGLWNGLKNGASNAWSGIKSVFSGVASFFKNTFETAWTAVKNVFSVGGKIFDGIKDGIVNAFKAIVNAIIGGINKVVAIPFNAINDVLNTIRNINILGVEPFKGLISPISVPQIPKLKTGTDSVPYDEMPAILHKGEQVVPEKYNPTKNSKYIKEALMDSLNNFASERREKALTTQRENQKLVSLLEKYLPIFEEKMGQDIVLDDDTVVSKIAPKIDKKLGELAYDKRRGR